MTWLRDIPDTTSGGPRDEGQPGTTAHPRPGRLAELAARRPVLWATGCAAAAALVLGLVMPRGPMTTADALVSMAVGVTVGAVAGFLGRSRWAMLVAPVAFVVVFELVRLGETGPTVDGIHLGSIYGIAAFVTGRLFQGVLTLLPMVVGVAYGAAAARRRGAGSADAATRHLTAGLVLRRVGLGVSSIALVVLAILIARPASTDPILGPDGKPLAGSVAELTSVKIGGHDQALMIRGRSVDKPVLLFLAGGPGGSEIGSMRTFQEGLERDFVVATWDQRGTGKSATAYTPSSTLTLDQSVSDTIAVTNYLRRRFAQKKIYLVGNSWGTILGVLAAQKRPELYHAFVGAGQMVDPTATDRMFYADTLTWAGRTGNTGLLRKLRRNGPPPYADVSKYEAALSHESDWNPYPGFDAFQKKGEMPGNLKVEEYSLMEKIRTMPAFLDTFYVLYPQLRDVDLRRTAATLDVPVYLAQGAHEARGRAVLADEWFAALKAPSKQRFTFGRSGHKTLFEQPGRFQTVMAQAVADTYPSRAAQMTSP